MYRRADLRIVASLIVLAAGQPVAAQGVSAFDVPGGRLEVALQRLARQANIDIGGVDLVVPGTAVRALKGRMPVARALDRLLAGSGLAAVAVGPGAWRLERAKPRPQPAVVARAAPRASPAPSSEIVVTAGKREMALSQLAGSAVVVDLDGSDASAPFGADATSWLVRQSPILQQTELGSGRNKLFIRGIADSSFTGPTQSTASTYFAEVRMGYNGPDPNLALLDMRRAEILEGPQGTLYGAGSLGGVIRLMPRQPVLGEASGMIEGGVTATQGGALGKEVAGVGNLSFGPSTAIRLLGYRQIEGGYIDDVGQRERNVNKTRTTGGRAALRIEPLDGWRLDIGVIGQTITAPDLQYGQLGLTGLTRRSAIAQPFEDDYVLARGTLAKRWSGGLNLVVSMGRVWHDTNQRYEATRATSTAPVAYDEDGRIRMTSQEARLSRTSAGGLSWVIGASRVRDTTAKARRIGFLATPRDIVGVTNRTRERALFGEATVPLFGPLSVTGGLRYTTARMDGEPDTRVTSAIIRGQTSKRADPSLGAAIQLSPRISGYARYSQGFRTAGLAVARGVGRVANYRSDSIHVGEAGVRLARGGQYGLSGSAGISYARWLDIQADLVDRFGFPYTGNLGNGRLATLELLGNWLGRGGWNANAGLVLTRSKLTRPEPEFVAATNQSLSDTPRVTVTLSGGWKHDYAKGRTLSLDAGGRYVGHSSLGLGTVLAIPQGDYLETRVAARYTAGGIGFFAELSNLLNERSNRFAIGNPFGVAARDQYTPQRPRNMRLGASASF
ncbi:TonB-dependent receptor [Sphingomonas naphthae]|uniref:TonB-dependent receptor n=1 Tax=Sphingomonas naphthae TaxID=1813468 RepID=A0ABY7TKK8_9SPHN|nr:TonB-dependent receptor [Sphingomonas naphthae]WCT73316.1 TonB-dependent receptor [Sphingomonas naphthae]